MKRPMVLLSLLLSIVVAAATAVAEGAEPPLPRAEASQLPRWRGFNLTNKFHREWSNRPFEEDDFRWIHEFGFNFVRLPMDYRTWIAGDDWTQFNEEVLREIDQVVAWGGALKRLREQRHAQK